MDFSSGEWKRTIGRGMVCLDLSLNHCPSSTVTFPRITNSLNFQMNSLDRVQVLNHATHSLIFLQTIKAAGALLKHTKTERNEKMSMDLLAPDDEFVWINVMQKKIGDASTNRPAKMFLALS